MDVELVDAIAVVNTAGESRCREMEVCNNSQYHIFSVRSTFMGVGRTVEVVRTYARDTSWERKRDDDLPFVDFEPEA